MLQIKMLSAGAETTTKRAGTFVVVSAMTANIVALIEYNNESLYRISSGVAGLVVLGMPSLDDAKSSTFSLIPSLV